MQQMKNMGRKYAPLQQGTKEQRNQGKRYKGISFFPFYLLFLCPCMGALPRAPTINE
jgi:hypothetical protein